MFLPIKLIASYSNKMFSMSISAAFVKINIPLKKKTENKKTETKEKKKIKKSKQADDFSRFEKFFAVLNAFYESSDRIRKCIAVEKLEVNSEYGSEDAAFTGFAIGIAYAEIYKLVGFLGTIFTLKQPIITITPVFADKAVFELSFEGIIKTKAAHIIFTAIKFYREYRKAIKRKD